jgi:prolyl-tRNA synthetase
MELSPSKLAAVTGARSLRPAAETEILAVGAVAGYGSPVGVTGAMVVVDDLVAQCGNLVVGANREGFHLTGCSCGRDYSPDVVADLVAAGSGDPCPDCESPVRLARGVEIANIFKLGSRYSQAMGCAYTGPGGDARPVVMGSYGIGVGRLLACIAEEHHDARGLCWPVTVAPYAAHLIEVGNTEGVATRICEELTAAGLEVLFDDRAERAGVKFNDADLMGMPIRITAGARSLAQDSAEVKTRRAAEGELVPLGNLTSVVKETLEEMGRAGAPIQ